MPQHHVDNQYLMDRAAIHDLHARYFQGLDRSNPDQVRSCFTADVQAHYDGRSALRPDGAPSQGIDALMNSIITFKRQQSGEWKITTHFMGNLNINYLEGDVAETETNALAFLVVAGEPADQVVIRSLRYMDRLRRVERGWRISERRHTLDWSCQVPAIFAVTMAQRLGKL
jgi:hypothetical protein